MTAPSRCRRRRRTTAPIMAAALGALRDAAKSRVFWILFATFFICGASTNGLVQVHLIPMCLDFGIPQVAGRRACSPPWACSISSAPSARAGCRTATTTAICCSGIMACAACRCCSLPFTDFSFYGLSLFAMFYGLDWIATVPPTVRLTAQRFGPERANLVFGWIFAGHQLGAATAAFGAGLSRTLLASYLPAFFAAGALCIVAAVIVLMMSRTRSRCGLRRRMASSDLAGYSLHLIRRLAACHGRILMFIAGPGCGSARPAARTRTAANGSCADR